MKESTKDLEATSTGSTQEKSEPKASTPPRVINLGTVKRNDVKELKKGHGDLMEDVVQICDHEIAKLPAPGKGKMYQPVVVVYRRTKKSKKRKMNILGATIDRKKLRKNGISL